MADHNARNSWAQPIFMIALSTSVWLLAEIAMRPPALTTELNLFTTRVHTSQGVVRGFHVDYGSDRNEQFFGSGDIFLGIPFAEPPVDKLRFQLPQPVCEYDEEVGSLEYKSRCAQVNMPGHPYKSSSEDCLYLNVFTPNVTGKYPVMVWIHGGAFVMGGADEYHYKGAVRNFVSNGVVVVTIQYRLGPFGFFTTYTPEFPANAGLYDTLLALKWVKEEIGAFGGDPGQITLFGESAGAMSISLLSLSPLSKDLFHRVIMSSGSATVSFFAPNDMRGSMQRERAHQWCNVAADPITSRAARAQLQTCLAGLSAEQLSEPDKNLGVPGSLRWTPVVDGAIFPKHIEDLARSRPPYDAFLMDMPVEQAHFAPSYYSGDVSSFGPHSLKEALLNRNYGYLTEAQLDKMVAILIDTFKTSDFAADYHLGWFKLVMDAISAERYTYRGRLEAEWLKSSGSNTYLSTFTYGKRVCGTHSAIPGYDPNTHAADICYLWFTPADWQRAADEGKVTARDVAMANTFAQAYTQFAKNGTVGWAESGDDYRFVLFDDTLSAMGADWRGKERRLFTEVLPSVIGDNPPLRLSPIVESVLTNQGALALEEWRRLLSTCQSPP